MLLLEQITFALHSYRDPREGAAVVVDGYGCWPWFRRDYPEIRTLIELGWEEAWDNASRTR